MHSSVSAAAFSQLVGAIYDCAVDAERWPDALDAMRRTLGYHHAILALHELPTGRVLLDQTSNIPSPWREARVGYQDDAVALWGGVEFIRRYPVDRPAALSRVNPAGLGGATNRWATEWAAPQGIVDHLALVLARDGGAIGCVGMGRHRDGGMIDDRDVAAARLLIPHLQRAAAIGRMLEEHRAAAGRLADALDLLHAPVVLLAADAAILHANAAARALLAAGRPLAALRGRLSSPLPDVARAVRRALAECGRGEGPPLHGGFGIPARHDDGVYALHVLPLGASAVRPRPVARAVAALFVASPAPRPGATADLVTALYGLTPAEARVFVQVADGRTPAEAADALGVAPSTLHTHLLRVFAKLGVHRQADLVRLAAALEPPAARGGQASDRPSARRAPASAPA
jgi:DNA-binding CsgD family transcriptional regulator/PAS domain-containing protein